MRGNVVYLSGVAADDRSAGVKEQTTQILSKAEDYLKEPGTDKSTTLTASIIILGVELSKSVYRSLTGSSAHR
jgi:hypothetical protein